MGSARRTLPAISVSRQRDHSIIRDISAPRAARVYRVSRGPQDRSMNHRPLTILCVTSYEKGQEFLRTCKSLGCRVLLLTVEKFRDGNWPRESIEDLFLMPENLSLQH